jgi:hypothetical protein
MTDSPNKQQKNYKKYKKYYDEYGARKVICDCGAEIRYDSKKRHRKTDKHIKNIMMNTEQDKI